MPCSFLQCTLYPEKKHNTVGEHVNFVRNNKTLLLFELYFPLCEDDFIAADTTAHCMITHKIAVLGFKVERYSMEAL
jgi:hypothetical protein